jgi:hypothetical protein
MLQTIEMQELKVCLISNPSVFSGTQLRWLLHFAICLSFNSAFKSAKLSLGKTNNMSHNNLRYFFLNLEVCARLLFLGPNPWK